MQDSAYTPLFLYYEHIYIYKYALEACVLIQITTLTRHAGRIISYTGYHHHYPVDSAPVFPKPDTNP